MPDEFHGLVIGGPYDGRMLSSRAPHYQVGVSNDLPPLYSMSGPKEVSMELEVFTYIHYRWVDANFWIPMRVNEKKMYDYHHYSHPMEYILKKLADGYNPIARR